MLFKKTYSRIVHFVIKNKPLFLILALATTLRIVGIYPGYHPYHSDEGMSYSSAIEMIRNLNLDPIRYDYPALIPLIHAILYIVFFIPLFILKNLLFSPEELPTKGRNLIELWQQVVIQNQQTHVLFWGRYITAFFGVAVVFMVYKVAASFFKDRRVGLMAAFLTAVNFRQVLNSHLGLPDIYNAFFLLLSLFVFSLLPKNPTSKNYLFSGVSLGLYFSTKFQILVTPAFLLIHAKAVWQQTKKKNPITLFKNFFSPQLFITCFTTLIVILLINPYHIIRWEEFLAVNSYTALKYTIGVNFINFFPLYYLYRIGIGEFVSLAALVGIFFGLHKYPFSSLALLFVILPFFYVFVYYTGGGYYVRNFVTITPVLLIFAGVFFVEICSLLFRRGIIRNIAILAVLIFVSYNSIKNSIINVYYFSKPWGFEEAYNWAKDNIPVGSRVVSHPWDKYPRDRNLEIIPFEQNEILSISEMREDGADFAFINMDWLTLSSYWWMQMDLKHFLLFGGKPNDILANNFSAVSSQELASWSVATFIKPWQSPDMNFLIIKIPELPKIEIGKIVADFSFDHDDQFYSWYPINVAGDTKRIVFDKFVGKTNPGSIKMEKGINRYPIVMMMSPAIQVDPKNTFFIEGWVKTLKLFEKKNRDGFLRVDFYQNKPKFNVKSRSLYASVSSRVFGEPGWHKKEILVFPPKEAKFMTVSVQINNYSEFWFDDIKIYKLEDVTSKPKEKTPYLDYRIPDDILFPYSQGGL